MKNCPYKLPQVVLEANQVKKLTRNTTSNYQRIRSNADNTICVRIFKHFNRPSGRVPRSGVRTDHQAVTSQLRNGGCGETGASFPSAQAGNGAAAHSRPASQDTGKRSYYLSRSGVFFEASGCWRSRVNSHRKPAFLEVTHHASRILKAIK